MAAKNVLAKSWPLPASWNGRRYSDPTKVPLQSIFFDDFSSGDLSKTGNGFAWGSSDNSSVVSQKLRIAYPASANMAEQRFTLGTNKYKELWVKYDLYVSPDCNHQPDGGSDNNKGHIMLWSNTNGTSANDGYNAPGEMLFSLELNPHSNGDGGSFIAPRIHGFTSANVNIIDYNGANEAICPNGIVVADKGISRQFIIHVKSATYLGAGDNTNYYGAAADGVLEIWKDGVLLMRNLELGLYNEEAWQGFNRGYLFGARNAVNSVADYLDIDNWEISTTNLWGVS